MSDNAFLGDKEFILIYEATQSPFGGGNLSLPANMTVQKEHLFKIIDMISPGFYRVRYYYPKDMWR